MKRFLYDNGRTDVVPLAPARLLPAVSGASFLGYPTGRSSDVHPRRRPVLIVPNPSHTGHRPPHGPQRKIKTSLARVTILDSACAGMNPEILPQDDLFGHVNGQLRTAEIPAGRSSTGSSSRTLFMSWARCWRFKSRIEQEKRALAVDPHAPAEFRANMVRNLDEFHEAFGTGEDDPLTSPRPASSSGCSTASCGRPQTPALD